MTLIDDRGPGASAPGPRPVRPPLWWFLVPLLVAALGLFALQSRSSAERVADLRADRGAGPVLRVAPVASVAAPPESLVVPALGLDVLLDGLRTDREGALQVPEDPMSAGWYADGPAPGDLGPAVLAGHLDSPAGPGVFARLLELHPGSTLSVRRSDGTLADFVVDEVTTFAKRDFPTERVYAGDGRSSLRIITCGGDSDPETGRYRSNTVVFASFTGESLA